MNHNVSVLSGSVEDWSICRLGPFRASVVISGPRSLLISVYLPVVADSSRLSSLAPALKPSVLGVVLALLTGALVLDVVLSSHWTGPFREPGTWVLIGVVAGVAIRGVGQQLARQGRKGQATCRRLSLAVWMIAALGGLISLIL